MRRHLLASLAMIAGLIATACTIDSPTAPQTGARALANEGVLPGSRRTFDTGKGRGEAIRCVPKAASYGSAVIGPRGGTLLIGPHKLIVPPGALRERVRISGTVPAGKPFQIDLQPHGLQFKKPAGLILDATDCVNVPTIVYLIDQITVSPPILALYSNFWHTIACPIWHFSGYAIAFEEGGSEE